MFWSPQRLKPQLFIIMWRKPAWFLEMTSVLSALGKTLARRWIHVAVS